MTAPANPLSVDPEPTPAKMFIAVDRCPEHGYAMLSVLTLDANGFGGGIRLLGPKSCCPQRREIERWAVTPDTLHEIGSVLISKAPR